MAPVNYKQDLPPAGGYAKIVFERIPAKQILGPFSLLAGFIGITSFGLYVLTFTKKRIRKEKLELRDSKIALEPFLLAERDRAFLKQLIKNRDEESELMKDVKGWYAGTLYGEPIYKTLPDDYWMDPIIQEYYAHSRYKYYYDRAYFQVYH